VRLQSLTLYAFMTLHMCTVHSQIAKEPKTKTPGPRVAKQPAFLPPFLFLPPKYLTGVVKATQEVWVLSARCEMGGLGAHRPRPLSSDAPKKRDDKKDSPAGKGEMKSPSGKSAKDYMHEIKEKIMRYGGPDITKEGWTCVMEMVAVQGEGSSDAAHPRQLEAHPCYISPTGEKFTSRTDVMRKLGLKKKEKKEARGYSRQEAYERARQYFKKTHHDNPPPVKIEGLTIRAFGKIEYERKSFHDDRHIWPVGFKSSWKDTEENTLYESEVLDGAQTGEVGLGSIDGPIFMVTVKKDGEKPVDHYGKSPKDAWRKAVNGKEKTEHFGLSIIEVRRRIEGLKHANACKRYRFMEEGSADDDRKEKDKSGSSSKAAAKTSKGKEAVINKAMKVKDKIEKEHKPKEKKDVSASKKEQLLLAKEKKEEAQRKAKEEAAAKRKATAEEAAKKRKEQELEKQWLARYPIEDLALGVEAQALKEAESNGHDLSSQRIAAKTAVEAIERGYKSDAALCAARTVAARLKAGNSLEEAMEVAFALADDVNVEDEKELCPYLDAPVVDDEQLWLKGSAVRMLFSDNEGSAAAGEKSGDRWYTGWLSKHDPEANEGCVSFFEGEAVDVKLPDNEVQLLPQGALHLPHGAPMPARASSLAADAHFLMTFVDSFRGDLSLPKGTFNDLIRALYNPAGSSFLGDLYFSLLKSSMQAAQNQSLTVPSQWQGESTLTFLSWPEILRRWLVCGPYAPIHR
jgi:hypothetical protein